MENLVFRLLMKQVHLDTGLRATLAEQILAVLKNAVPGSTAHLRGSLANGNADAYSDIDILWEVPDESFQSSVGGIEAVLAEAGKVESLREEPALQNSKKRRLFFVQYESLPLFWRVDLDVFARSVGQDPEYDLHNEAASGIHWSPTRSALMNAIAALKALLRGRSDMAGDLLARGFARVGVPVPQKPAEELILELCSKITDMDVSCAGLAGRIAELHYQVFGQG